MSDTTAKPTMDIMPWPDGEGFQGGTSWWDYVLSQNERDRLSILMMAALISEEVCNLLLKHDSGVLNTFGLSEQTIMLLSAISASTLAEFAQTLVLNIDLYELERYWL
jgi:hypothetical protein